MTRREASAQLAFTQLVLFGVLARPEELMDPALRRIDELLADDALVDLVHEAMKKRSPQSARRGRKGTPAAVALRLLALKHLRQWSYDQLEWEVTGNLVYRRFCRIEDGKVPDAKTMVRLGQLLEGPVLRAIFERVVEQAVERKVTRGRRMRVDTTVVEAPIHHPTDSALCQDTTRVLHRLLSCLHEAGVELPKKLRNVAVSVKRRLREIAQALRLRGERAHEAIKKPYRRLLRVTGRLVRHAVAAQTAASEQLRDLSRAQRKRARRALDQLALYVPRAKQIVKQARARILRGVTDSPGKIISLFEPHVQILRRGKLRKPVEFGVVVKVQEAEGGIVTDIGPTTHKQDAPLLVPSVERHVRLFKKPPSLVTTDRGFHSIKGEKRIEELGVVKVAIPKPGYRSPKRIKHERQRWFQRGRAWRQGSEARISRLKHSFGMARSRYRGEAGMQRTALWAGISNNLVAMARHGAA